MESFKVYCLESESEGGRKDDEREEVRKRRT
jgi:hypothetical protein